MKSISSYIKSKSIREYYENENIKLNIVQAAFIIWHNDDISLEEKSNCYKTIAETYDDMSVETMENGDIHSIYIKSFKDFLFGIINYFKEEYNYFVSNSDGSVYSIGSQFIINEVFYSFEDCINFIKNHKEKYKNNFSNLGLTIYKVKDKNDPNKYPHECILLNGSMEIMNFAISNQKIGINNPYNIFNYIYIEMPHPFKRGDIVKAWYKHSTEYYCIDVMHCWDEKMCKANKIDDKHWFTPISDTEKKMRSYPECMDFGGYRISQFKNKCNEEMNTVFAYDAGDNPIYMDLEFVDDNDLQGYLQMLKICREYIKRILNDKQHLTPLSIVSYYKEIEAEVKGLPPVVYDKPEDAYYEQYFACPLTYL